MGVEEKNDRFELDLGVLAVKEAMWERVLVNKGLLAMGPKSKDVQEARGAFDTSLEIFVA